MTWSEERVALLQKLWAEGFSAAQIAKRLGHTTRNAVIGKIHRLGIARRITPTRPPRLRARAEPVIRRAPRQSAAHAQTTSPSSVALAPRKFAGDMVATVLTVRDGWCRFPIGDPAQPGFALCGRDVHCGPYCYDHARLAYEPLRRRRAG